MPIDPVTGSIAAGIGSTLLGGLMGSSQQNSANRANQRLAMENRQFIRHMSNTEWQRGTADMLKAGINPMLAVSQGGASTPNTTAATVIPEDAFARSVSSAGDKAMRALELANTQAIVKRNRELADQEEINTNQMRVKHNPMDRNPWDIERRTLEAKEREALASANIREIEHKVAEQVQGYNVASARALSQIQEREVDIQEIRAILMQLDIPEKEAIAKWFDTVGASSPAAKAAMSIGQWIKIIFGGK